MFRNLWRKFANKIVGDDPNPQPSILDILDSRGTVPLDEDGEPLPPNPALERESYDEYEARQSHRWPQADGYLEAMRERDWS